MASHKLDSGRQLSRDAFSEKFLHRYLFDLFYRIATQDPENDKIALDNLLPDELKGERVNMVYPEQMAAGEKYRADFTVYFKGIEEPLVVEVKLESKKLDKANQIAYLKQQEHGILIAPDVLDSKNQKKLIKILSDEGYSDSWVNDDLCSKKIDFKHLREWYINKRLNLLSIQGFDDSQSYKKYWIVMLRGPAVMKNWDNMEKYCQTTGSQNRFWAWSNYCPNTISSCLNMSRGDEMLFIVAKTSGKERAGILVGPEAKKAEIGIKRWYKLELKSGHLVFDEPEILEVFEDNKPAYERGWPHYVKFSRDKNKEGEFKGTQGADFGKRGEFSHIFSQSGNNSGAAVQVPKEKFQQLESKLESLSYD